MTDSEIVDHVQRMVDVYNLGIDRCPVVQELNTVLAQRDSSD